MRRWKHVYDKFVLYITTQADFAKIPNLIFNQTHKKCSARKYVKCLWNMREYNDDKKKWIKLKLSVPQRINRWPSSRTFLRIFLSVFCRFSIPWEYWFAVPLCWPKPSATFLFPSVASIRNRSTAAFDTINFQGLFNFPLWMHYIILYILFSQSKCILTNWQN